MIVKTLAAIFIMFLALSVVAFLSLELRATFYWRFDGPELERKKENLLIESGQHLNRGEHLQLN